jgi:hypothetical protein
MLYSENVFIIIGVNMFGERRKHPRVAINRTARIQAESGGTSRECTITDISDRGARLFADGDIPDQFYLLISGEKPIRHECRVAWRLGGEMGVEFVTHTADQARLEAMKRLSDEARKAFRPAN